LQTAVYCQDARPSFARCTIELPQADFLQPLISALHSRAAFEACSVVRNAGDLTARQTYSLSGTTLSDVEHLIQFDPRMSDGAVFQWEGDRLVPTHVASTPTVLSNRPATAALYPGVYGLGAPWWSNVRWNSHRAPGVFWDCGIQHSGHSGRRTLEPTLSYSPYHRRSFIRRAPCRSRSPVISGAASDPALFYAPYLRQGNNP
jgi:hypothetical protein